jgi:hypothetical protein
MHGLLADYKVSLRNAEGLEGEQALHSCHQRSANKLLQLCFKNGGIYIKLGQHIGQLVSAAPAVMVNTCAVMVNTCAVMVNTCAVMVNTCAVMVNTCAAARQSQADVAADAKVLMGRY